MLYSQPWKDRTAELVLVSETCHFPASNTVVTAYTLRTRPAPAVE